MRWLLCLALAPLHAQTDAPPSPVQLTAQQDRQRLLDLLHIQSLRPGADPRNRSAPNAANYDESKANPYPKLPDPLVLKNGKKVTTAKLWWSKRRAEIVEDFDREIYGRVPRNTPPVNWEVTARSRETNGDVPIIVKKLIGHVDNSAYPAITVNIEMTLTTPAAARGPVPVIMEFGFGRLSSRGPAPPTWQQQVLAKGWGYAVLAPASVQADNGAGLTQGIIGLVNKGQPRSVDDWGALRAWAWGASRALDYLETDKAVDARRVGIEGLSRYGKATIVTMAYDPRFAIAFVGSSGEGGVKLHRRNFGELVENVAGTSDITGWPVIFSSTRVHSRGTICRWMHTSWWHCARRVRCLSARGRSRWRADGWMPRGCSWRLPRPGRSIGYWAKRIWGRWSFRPWRRHW
jgi:hypothetical protein